MKVVDVGQGDAIIFYSNHHIALIDTGGLSKEGNVYYYTLEPLLHSLGITSIDYLILTHGDRDHCGDAEFILENFSVSHLYINDNQLSYFEKRISRFHPIKAFEGLSFSVGDFLFYQLNSGFTDENDNSQVYYVFYQDTKVLLMGDASVKTEKNLIKKYDIGFVDILKVGHHGSRTSTSDEFLRTITPRMAFISSGKDNKFQHPHQEVLEKLQRYFISVYNTQVDGTITYDFTRSIVFTDVE